MENFTVYMHKNKTNGKVYIGATACTVARRWQRGWGYRTQSQFYEAILKYGWDEFEHIVLFENLSKEKAFEKETLLIEQYQSTNPKYGYNKTAGGYGTNGWDMPNKTRKAISEKAKTRSGKKSAMYGKRHTLESRQKMSANTKRKYGKDNPYYGKHHTDEIRIKMHLSALKNIKKRSEAMSGVNNPMYGKQHSEETKAKMSEQCRGAKHINAKRVMCIETGVVYDYVGQAAKETGISRSGIAEVARGEKNSVHGYHWKYIDN